MGKALRHGFQTVFRAVVLTLPVQQRFVCPFLRHIQSVAEAFRKIHHPAHIVRPVIQRNVGNSGAVRFGLRQLRGHPAPQPVSRHSASAAAEIRLFIKTSRFESKRIEK